MDSESTTLTIRVTPALRERLDRLAKATDRSRAWLANAALEAWLDANEWQVAEIEAAVTEADAGDFATEDEVAATFARGRRG